MLSAHLYKWSTNASLSYPGSESVVHNFANRVLFKARFVCSGFDSLVARVFGVRAVSSTMLAGKTCAALVLS